MSGFHHSVVTVSLPFRCSAVAKFSCLKEIFRSISDVMAKSCRKQFGVEIGSSSPQLTSQSALRQAGNNDD